MICPSPRKSVSGDKSEDYWERLDDGLRHCSFCRSIMPDELVTIKDRGWLMISNQARKHIVRFRSLESGRLVHLHEWHMAVADPEVRDWVEINMPDLVLEKLPSCHENVPFRLIHSAPEDGFIPLSKQ